jgi:Domain of unknown function (DUF4124)
MLCPVRTRLALLILVTAVAAAGTTTYRWVDADGVHYSDQPHPGAEQITLSRAPTYASEYTRPSTPASAGAKPAARDDDFRYDSCAVIQPAEDQVFTNIDALAVSVQAQPPLRGSDRVTLNLDGQNIQADSGQQQFQVSPVSRGTHTVSASITGGDGRSLCQSPALKFHVHQAALGRPRVQPLPH